MLFLDGVYVDRLDGSARFRWVRSPTSQELTQLAQAIAHHVSRFLERQGLLERDAENSYLATDAVPGGSMDQLLGHSIIYRIAVGPQAGRKVFTLQTLPACDPEEQYSDTAGKMADFSLHAGVAARADERKKLERLCRYISRPAVSEKRLSLTSNGNIRYQLKTPYRESLPHERSECFGYGTTHVIFEPLNFMARLTALVPKPRVNLTRFHGVFVGVPHQPNSKCRALVTPAKRGKGNKREENCKTGDCESANSHAAMTWAQRLKRVFNINITTCEECGGAVKIIASIEDPAVIKQILAHLEKKRNQKNSIHYPRAGHRHKGVCSGSRDAPFNSPNCWLRKKRQVAGLPGGSNLAGLPSGKGRYYECRRDSVRFRMPSRLDGFANHVSHRSSFSGNFTEYCYASRKIRSDQSCQKGVLMVDDDLAKGCLRLWNCSGLNSFYHDLILIRIFPVLYF